MASIRLKYVTADRDRHGNVRYYVRLPGREKTRLRGLPGSEEFMSAYQAVIAGVGDKPRLSKMRWTTTSPLGSAEDPKVSALTGTLLKPVFCRNSDRSSLESSRANAFETGTKRLRLPRSGAELARVPPCRSQRLLTSEIPMRCGPGEQLRTVSLLS